MLLNRVRDWRGGEAVLAKREWSDSGTPESPTCRMAGNAQRKIYCPFAMSQMIFTHWSMPREDESRQRS